MKGNPFCIGKGKGKRIHHFLTGNRESSCPVSRRKKKKRKGKWITKNYGPSRSVDRKKVFIGVIRGGKNRKKSTPSQKNEKKKKRAGGEDPARGGENLRADLYGEDINRGSPKE